jgi:ferritin-like protein
MTLTYHEPVAELSAETREIHRAIATLVEELEAVDWYHQRVDATGDEDLRGILTHHRDEEIEHAAMALEWLRRKMSKFDEQLRTYLFTSQSVTNIEDSAETESEAPAAETRGSDDLGVGKLEN